jgi:hypothetical protein
MKIFVFLLLLLQKFYMLENYEQGHLIVITILQYLKISENCQKNCDIISVKEALQEY